MPKTYNIDTCDIYITQKILKSKWVVLIIHAIYNDNQSFNDLSKCILHISNTELSRNISILKKEKIIIKNNDLIYSLTQKGTSLYHLTKEMQKWGQKYN